MGAGKYRAVVDERWPSLTLMEDERGDLDLPDRLVRQLDKAWQQVEEAELAVARWVKYADAARQGGDDMAPLISKLDAAKTGEEEK